MNLGQLMALMPPPATISGIRFGTRAFSEPSIFFWAVSLGLPSKPGIYAILVQDERGTPRKFRVLYFGEAGDMSERVGSSHERYNDWVRAAGADSLYVAYSDTTGLSDDQRKASEKELIRTYNPECNVAGNRYTNFYGYVAPAPRPSPPPFPPAVPSLAPPLSRHYSLSDLLFALPPKRTKV